MASSTSSNKTVASSDGIAAVDAALAALPEPRQSECRQLGALMQEVSGHPPVMWGRMVGFGRYHYRYDSGREGDMFEIGFASPATGKGEISLYLSCASELRESFLARLGKHRSAVACVYIKRLADIDLGVLRELLVHSLHQVRTVLHKP